MIANTQDTTLAWAAQRYSPISQLWDEMLLKHESSAMLRRSKVNSVPSPLTMYVERKPHTSKENAA